MADTERPSPFVRTLPPPVEGAPSPFARPPSARPAAAATATLARPAPPRSAPSASFTPAPPAKPAPAVSVTITASAGPGTAKPAEAGPSSLLLGVLAGLLAAIVGATLWAGITVLTNYQIGWMAVGVGALVGLAMRKAGQGTSVAYGVLGAALALGGCLAGNFLTGAIVLSRHWHVSLPVVFARLTPDLGRRLMTAMFSPMDLLFYALALWQGYKLSIVRTKAA